MLLDLRPGLRQHWLGYLLRDQRIRYREPLFTWDASGPGEGRAFVQYAVVEKALDASRRLELGEPWYQPATYARLWGNDDYELRARRDATLGQQPWGRRWPRGTSLAVDIVPRRRTLVARLGGETRESGLGAGPARTLQLRLLAMDPENRFAVPSFARGVALKGGSWLLDLDLACLSGGRTAVDLLAGDGILSEVRLLTARTGDPKACLETARLPSGGAYLEQEVADGRVRLRATLVRPEHAGERTYRLGFHVIDPAEQALFGVWSLDFPPGARVRRGTLELDLRDRSVRGEVDGRPADVPSGRFDVDAGSFQADAVWWQLNPNEQIEVQPALWFQRTPGGTVAVTRASPGPSFTALADP
jgi:hypothetical protein